MPDTQELNFRDELAGRVDARLPVIDGGALAGGRWDEIVPLALESARAHGFLCVELPPAQRALAQSTLETAAGFFALPDARKALVRDEGSTWGWTPSSEEPAYQPGTVSNVESFDAELPLIDSADDPHWPDLPGFRDAVVECWHGYARFADAVLELLARAAGIEPRFLADRCSTRALNTLRLLHYPGGPLPSDPGEVGIAAHTDFECITLIYQTAPGLELRSPRGKWLDAPVAPGRLFVLLDDMLERWTNGFFQATGHRVRRTLGERYSLVMFIAVNDGEEVAPLRTFVSADNPVRYAPVGQAEHIEAEMARARTQMLPGSE